MVIMLSRKSDRILIKEEFEQISQSYKLLGNKIKTKLEDLLNKHKIPVHKIELRIKSFNSFCHKIKRFSYNDPFNQINDICGLRVICFYYSDLFRISKIIKDEFKVLESDIKGSNIEIAEFGYRSWHYIIRVKEEGINRKTYLDFHNFRAEIQLRTIIMHTWAAIQHEISFKKEYPVSDNVLRRFSIISALLEMIDEQFDQLREDQSQYMDSLTFKPLNFEKLDFTFRNFQKILDAYFPYRVSSMNESKILYYEITHLGFDIMELLNLIERAKEILPVFEEDFRKLLLAEKKVLETDEEKLLRLVPLKSHQVGALRIILNIFSDRFWEAKRGDMPLNYANFIIKWRLKLRD